MDMAGIAKECHSVRSDVSCYPPCQDQIPNKESIQGSIVQGSLFAWTQNRQQGEGDAGPLLAFHPPFHSVLGPGLWDGTALVQDGSSVLY